MSPLTPEALVYGLPQASDPSISPDGTRVVYTLTTVDRRTHKDTRQLWLCDIDGGSARQLTWSGTGNSGARWSPDGTAVAFVSDRDEGSGIYLLPLAAGGESRKVTSHRSGVGNLAWSPDGTRIAYSATWDPENPDDVEAPSESLPKVRVTRRLDYKLDGRGYLGDARTHVWVVDVASGGRHRVTFDLVDHGEPAWSPDGRWIATARHDGLTASSQLLLTPVDDGDGPPVVVGPSGGLVRAYAWSPDGAWIVYAGGLGWAIQAELFVYGVAERELRQRTTDFDGVLMTTPVWLDERQVLVHVARAGASELEVVDCLSATREQVARWTALHGGLSVDRAGRYAVQAHSSYEATGEISVHNLQSGETSIVTKYSQPLLQTSPPAIWERLEVWQGAFLVEGWLLKPPDFDPARRYPVVLTVHGGPESFYGYSYSQLQQLLASNGFLVVAANPRGSTSYGRVFADQVLGDWGVEPLKDLEAVLDAVVALPWADGERIGITGGSYGGYMTAWAIGQSQRFKAAVAVAVTFDLESQYLGADFDHAYGDYAWGGPPHANRAWYEAQSPSTFAHRVTTPTLILHGEEDHRCPIGQAEEMFGALKKAGCEVEFVRYPGGSHGFSRSGPPEHRVDYLTRCLAWFTEHL